jgi:ethanolamine utilization protein EutN
MQLARVMGSVVATLKDPNLVGVTLLLIQPITPTREPVGKPLVAVDSMGAGVGEHVFFVRGKEASFPFMPVEVPADAGIVGIVDSWDSWDSWDTRDSADASGSSHHDLGARRR